MSKTSHARIGADVERHVSKLLTEKLSGDHRFHHLLHTLAVRQACLELGRRMELSHDDLEVLEIASLFHDTGFTEVYEGHEAVSHRLAKAFLEKHEYPKALMEKVLSCIDATFPPYRPTNVLEKIIRDADLANLGSLGYPQVLEALRHEWKVFLGQTYSDAIWYELNYDFVRKHRYFTMPGEELYESTRMVNEKYLRKMAKERGKKKKEEEGAIQGSRSAQMMFKTALRNHLDLSNLADNKANIILSVNALILTIAGPLAFSYIKDNLLLLIPLAMLLATCLTSMVFATLATRPIKMSGYTSPEQVATGKSNLFFFGNFYAMPLEEYTQGISSVVADGSKLESSIQRDLYFLGRSLGRKYRRLRDCYTVFMYGIIASVIVMIFIYALYLSA